MSYDPVPGTDLAAIVTFLEMRERPATEVPASTLDLQRIQNPTPERYRALFRLVGAPWLWFSRLTLDDAKLSEIIADPKVELYVALDGNGRDVGMLELDFREAGQC